LHLLDALLDGGASVSSPVKDTIQK
jgi:hypothetical protein